jgi:hypothetical protein
MYSILSPDSLLVIRQYYRLPLGIVVVAGLFEITFAAEILLLGCLQVVVWFESLQDCV